MHPSMERVWDADDVEPEIREALDMVDRLAPPDDLRLAAFQFAVQLLTQRAQRAQVGIPPGAMLLGGG